MAFAPPSPYGGFWIRFLAIFIDGIILSVVATPLALLFIMPGMNRMMNDMQAGAEPSPKMIMSMLSGFAIYTCLAWAGQWLYEAILTSSSWQGTIGKRILRLKVTDETGNRIGFGRATGRFFGKFLSTLILDIGFIMAAFTDRKRALHDMLAGTLVMKY